MKVGSNMTRLDEIKARLLKATPGPWDVYFATGEGPAIITFTENEKGQRIYKDFVLPLMPRNEQDWHNAILVAGAPSDLSFLLKLVEDLKTFVEKVADERDDAVQCHARQLLDKLNDA